MGIVKITYNPRSSETKEADFFVTLGGGMKKEKESPEVVLESNLLKKKSPRSALNMSQEIRRNASDLSREKLSHQNLMLLKNVKRRRKNPRRSSCNNNNLNSGFNNNNKRLDKLINNSNSNNNKISNNINNTSNNSNKNSKNSNNSSKSGKLRKRRNAKKRDKFANLRRSSASGNKNLRVLPAHLPERNVRRNWSNVKSDT